MQTSVQALLVLVSCVWVVRHIPKGYRSLPLPERPTYILFGVLALGSLGSVVLGGQKGLLCLLLTGAISLTVLAARLLRPRDPSPIPSVPKRVAVAMLLLWLWLFSVDMAANDLSWGRVGAYVAAAIIPILCWLFALTSGLRNWSVASICTSYLALSNFIALTDPGGAWRQCDEFKCNQLGALYKGPFVSENFMAVLSAFALVEWLTVERSVTSRRTGLVLCGAMLFASGSRGSLIGVAAAVIWGVAVQARGRASGRHRRIPFALSLATALGVSAVAYHLIANATYDQFSNRGNVWIQAFSHVREGHLLYGLGLSSWGDLQAAGELPAHFAHSQYLILLFAGGIVALLLFVGVFSVALSRPSMPEAIRGGWSGAPIVFLLVAGLVEVIWNPASWDAFSFMIIGVFAQTFVAVPRQTEPEQQTGNNSGRVNIYSQRPRRSVVGG